MVGHVHGGDHRLEVGGHLRMIEQELLSPDAAEQDDCPAVLVCCRGDHVGRISHGRQS
jgi:hypothetical protein